jgi:ATP-dependent RNA helicase DeaD
MWEGISKIFILVFKKRVLKNPAKILHFFGKKVHTFIDYCFLDHIMSVRVKKQKKDPASKSRKSFPVKENAFGAFAIPESIVKSLTEMKFLIPSPIQASAIPKILDGKDLLGQAKTGTGKTAAFGIPILTKLDKRIRTTQALIIVPTRELALQVSAELKSIGKREKINIVTVYGGASMRAQEQELRKGAPIIVGTPGRLMDFMRQKVIKFPKLKIIVLDEADKMLDMGFREDIETVFSQIPKQKQVLMFSATMPKAIKELAKEHMKDYVLLNLSADTLTVEGITQYFLSAHPSQRVLLLLGLMHHFGIEKGLVFCETKRTVDWLSRQLQNHCIRVAKIHGDLSQYKRQQNLKEFKQGKYPLLLATNVAARGIHIEDISHVINFDMPEELETYVHRIGRTARKGKKGISITFTTTLKERQQIKLLETVTNSKIFEIKTRS